MSKTYNLSRDNRPSRHVPSHRGSELDKELKQVVDRSLASLGDQMEKILERHNKPLSKKINDGV